MASNAEKDFLKEIAELTQGLRAEIEAKQVGLDPSPAARRARRKAQSGGAKRNES